LERDAVHIYKKRPKNGGELIPHKLKDRNYPIDHFLKTFNERKKFLETRPEMAKEFRQEMQRFLPAEQISQILEQENFLSFIVTF
ncbi:MAG: hypothetical protein MRQ09_06245, partial [Candidatus Midichloria sp.]|nr:hypothetical protein [Candidatus Midichloria sp.]